MDKKYKILLVEDEDSIRKMVKDDLELEGFKVITAKDGKEGLKLGLNENVDLVLLDVMLPKLSGWDICRHLKKENKRLPIIMLTAKGQESDKVMGFDIGADDYVTKPFSILELIARVKAILRRTTDVVKEVKKYKFDNIIIDFDRHEIKKGKKIIDLSQKEFEILKILINNKGKVISRDDILSEIWGYKDIPTTRTVDNHILSLRQKLAGKREYIITVHGIGYKFIEQ